MAVRDVTVVDVFNATNLETMVDGIRFLIERTKLRENMLTDSLTLEMQFTRMARNGNFTPDTWTNHPYACVGFVMAFLASKMDKDDLVTTQAKH